ncbi:MAG: glycosyltransferase family 1 protein [Isosphaeraceae bacterium]
MRVTVVTETYYPQVNGVSRTLSELVDYLKNCGDQVQIIHPDYGTATHDKDTYLVRAISVPFYKELYLPVPPFAKVHRAMDHFRPEIVHLATEASLGLSVLNHTERRGIATVSSFHTNFDQYSAHYRLGFLSGLIWRYLRWFHNRTLQTYVPSSTTINDLQGRNFERLVHWPRGVDSTHFRPDRPGRERVRKSLGFGPDETVIVYVSRIAAEKNIAYLGDALSLVASTFPGVRLLFVGDGPAKSDLECRMGPSATFVGYRSGEDLADHYAAADLFAFASTTETFGNVILEAMASGLPVVALRAGGVGNIVRSGECGILVEPTAEPLVFARALTALIEDPFLRKKMSLAARLYAQSQSWEEIMRDLREHYARIVAEARPLPATAPG